MKTLKRILVPVDFAESSRASLEYALGLAEAYGASVDVLHVWLTPAYVSPAIAVQFASGRTETLTRIAETEAQSQLSDFLEKIPKPKHVPMKTMITYGVPHEVIGKLAPEYDIVIMGTHGRRGIAHAMLGSVTERVLRTSPRPVLVVRAS